MPLWLIVLGLGGLGYWAWREGHLTGIPGLPPPPSPSGGAGGPTPPGLPAGPSGGGAYQGTLISGAAYWISGSPPPGGVWPNADWTPVAVSNGTMNGDATFTQGPSGGPMDPTWTPATTGLAAKAPAAWLAAYASGANVSYATWSPQNPANSSPDAYTTVYQS